MNMRNTLKNTTKIKYKFFTYSSVMPSGFYIL